MTLRGLVNNPLQGIPGVSLVDDDALSGVKTYLVKLGPSRRETLAEGRIPLRRNDNQQAFVRLWWEVAPPRLFEATSTVWVTLPDEDRPVWMAREQAKRRFQGESLSDLLALQDFEDLGAPETALTPKDPGPPFYVWELVLLDALRSSRFRVTPVTLASVAAKRESFLTEDSLMKQLRARRRRIVAYLRSQRGTPARFEELVRAAVLVATLDRAGGAISQVEALLQLTPWELGFAPSIDPAMGARNRSMALRRAKGLGP